MLGSIIDNRPKIYLKIKGGAIVRHTHEKDERFTYVEGILENISIKNRVFHGEIVPYWYIELKDRDNSDLYLLGFAYGSNVFKSIILQLASKEGAKATKEGYTIRIEPYFSNGYEKARVFGGDIKLEWKTKDFPPIVKKKIGGRTVTDDSKRMKFISSLVEDINTTIKKGNR